MLTSKQPPPPTPPKPISINKSKPSHLSSNSNGVACSSKLRPTSSNSNLTGSTNINVTTPNTSNSNTQATYNNTNLNSNTNSNNIINNNENTNNNNSSNNNTPNNSNTITNNTSNNTNTNITSNNSNNNVINNTNTTNSNTNSAPANNTGKKNSKMSSSKTTLPIIPTSPTKDVSASKRSAISVENNKFDVKTDNHKKHRKSSITSNPHSLPADSTSHQNSSSSRSEIPSLPTLQSTQSVALPSTNSPGSQPSTQCSSSVPTSPMNTLVTTPVSSPSSSPSSTPASSSPPSSPPSSPRVLPTTLPSLVNCIPTSPPSSAATPISTSSNSSSSPPSPTISPIASTSPPPPTSSVSSTPTNPLPLLASSSIPQSSSITPITKADSSFRENFGLLIHPSEAELALEKTDMDSDTLFDWAKSLHQNNYPIIAFQLAAKSLEQSIQQIEDAKKEVKMSTSGSLHSISTNYDFKRSKFYPKNEPLTIARWMLTSFVINNVFNISSSTSNSTQQQPSFSSLQELSACVAAETIMCQDKSTIKEFFLQYPENLIRCYLLPEMTIKVCLDLLVVDKEDKAKQNNQSQNTEGENETPRPPPPPGVIEALVDLLKANNKPQSAFVFELHTTYVNRNQRLLEWALELGPKYVRQASERLMNRRSVEWRQLYRLAKRIDEKGFKEIAFLVTSTVLRKSKLGESPSQICRFPWEAMMINDAITFFLDLGTSVDKTDETLEIIEECIKKPDELLCAAKYCHTKLVRTQKAWDIMYDCLLPLLTIEPNNCSSPKNFQNNCVRKTIDPCLSFLKEIAVDLDVELQLKAEELAERFEAILKD